MGKSRMQVNFSPALSAFIQDPAHHKFLVGPVGSGKTIACIFLILILAKNQKPNPADGIRYTRFAVCRQTLQQAKQTVLKDMLQFFKGFYHYKVSETTIFIRSDDINCEIIFYPLDTPEDQKRLLSTQLTAVYFNEFIEINPELIVAAFGRTGRYPSALMGGCTWRGVFGDSNPGTKDSAWYELLKENLPQGWSYHEQENPFKEDENGDLVLRTDYDNKANLPPDYYPELLHGASETWATRYVYGQWGDSLSGQAVFKASFAPSWHVSHEEIHPEPGRIVVIGLDTGRHPAAIFSQINRKGQFVALDELYDDNMGMQLFMQTKIKPLVYSNRYQRCRMVCVCDPQARARGEIGEESVLDIIQQEGFEAHPAITNAISPRLRAVEKYMLLGIGGEPGFLVDLIHCPLLVRALQGGYRFKLRKSDQELEEIPQKNHPDSDIADALEYACLGSGRHVLGRIMRKSTLPPEQPVPVGGWT